MLDRRLWRHFDGWLLAAVILLSVIGTIMIFSAAQGDPNLASAHIQQAFTALAGLFILLVVAAIDYITYKNFSVLLYVAIVIGLIGVLFFGQENFGARRWYNIGGFFDLQPGELAKIILAISIAKFISDRQGRRPYLETIFLSGLMAMPCVALIMLQPNLSTALTIVFMWLVMIFVGGLEREHLTLIAGAAFAAVALFVLITQLPSEIEETKVAPTPIATQPLANSSPTTKVAPTPTPATASREQGFIRGYQIRRIENLIFGAETPGENYQSEQALIALGSGGILGKGYLQGKQTQLRFFPARHTDFIFSVIAEELGFIGASIVIALLGFTIIRSLWIGLIARDIFGRLLCIGIAAVLFLQTYINIAMQVGWAPVTGVVLPFISYGRSNLVVAMIAIGVIESVAMRYKKLEF
jgi:rod shape determining protein RodA